MTNKAAIRTAIQKCKQSEVDSVSKNHEGLTAVSRCTLAVRMWPSFKELIFKLF
jgi:hypothetical protein